MTVYLLVVLNLFRSVDVVVKQSIRLRDVMHESNVLTYIQDQKGVIKCCIVLFGSNEIDTPTYVVIERFGSDLTDVFTYNFWKHE